MLLSFMLTLFLLFLKVRDIFKKSIYAYIFTAHATGTGTVNWHRVVLKYILLYIAQKVVVLRRQCKL